MHHLFLMMLRPETLIYASGFLSIFALIIISMEVIVIIKRHPQLVNSLLANQMQWYKASSLPIFAFFVSLANNYKTYLGANLLIIFLCFIWGCFYNQPIALYIFALIFIINRVLSLRVFYNISGAELSLASLLAGLLISQYGLLFRSESLVNIGATFVAIQFTLVYFLSGVLKLFGKQWRNGQAIKSVLSTRQFGSVEGYALLDALPKWANRALCYSVIILELLFPLVLFLPLCWCLVIFSLTFLMHLSIARLTGINSFLRVFPASYPCMIYFNVYIFNA